MQKIRIFTAKNTQGYGLTDGEIEALNAEWESKAAGLGLAQHLPEYWQEAKRHVSEKLAGRAASGMVESGGPLPDDDAAELPALDVNLDDFDMGAASDPTAVALSGAESPAEFLSAELPELETISMEELEPAGFGEALAGEDAVEGMEPVEAAVAEPAPVEEPIAAAAPAQAVAGAQWPAPPTGEEKILAVAQPEPQAEADRQPAMAGEEAGPEVAAAIASEAEPGFMPGPQQQGGMPDAQKEASFFGKIISRLKKMFLP
jgi:hypothetical protein